MQQLLHNQSMAQLRRIPLLALDTNDGFTEEIGLSQTARVIKGDGTAAPALGSITELELGQYFYEATAAEVDELGFFLVRVIDSEMKTFYGAAQVTATIVNGFIMNEATAQKRKILILAFDENDGFTEETGLSPTAKVIKADGTADDADNTVTEIENGVYQYEFSQAELDQAGFILVRVIDAAMKTFYGLGQVVAAAAVIEAPAPMGPVVLVADETTAVLEVTSAVAILLADLDEAT